MYAVYYRGKCIFTGSFHDCYKETARMLRWSAKKWRRMSRQYDIIDNTTGEVIIQVDDGAIVYRNG